VHDAALLDLAVQAEAQAAESTRASAASRRWASCSPAISREKIATLACWAMAALRAKFSMRLVLPIPVRAATMIRSDGLRPPRSMSRSLRPVPDVAAEGRGLVGVGGLKVGLQELADVREVAQARRSAGRRPVV
jgi:hypothetical protein